MDVAKESGSSDANGSSDSNKKPKIEIQVILVWINHHIYIVDRQLSRIILAPPERLTHCLFLVV